MSIRCVLFGHEKDQGTNHFDIPLYPSLVDDEHLKDGFIAVTWYRCERCNRRLDTEAGHHAPGDVEYPLLPEYTSEPLN